MSYEPTIVIKKSDLDKYSEELEYFKYSKNEEKNKVMEYLKEIQKRDDVEISGIKIILCKPELSSFNLAIRKQLNNWNIEFGVYN